MLGIDCEILYDGGGKRLVFLGDPADEGNWDSHWLSQLTPKDLRKPDRFVVSVTEKYLPKGARVLDAGCGLARTVYGLHQAGYDAHGVDYAEETVAAVRKLAPELNLQVGDVRRLDIYPDGHFDGVWSLGVVEHFFDGFEDIAGETARVVRPGGYAFVTVPSMSPLRRMKARLGLYGRWNGGGRERFYQFALPAETVRQAFDRAGFALVATRPRGGFKGLKDESRWLQPLLQPLYDSRSAPLRVVRAGLDRLLGPLTFHTRLYVFRKR